MTTTTSAGRQAERQISRIRRALRKTMNMSCSVRQIGSAADSYEWRWQADDDGYVSQHLMASPATADDIRHAARLAGADYQGTRVTITLDPTPPVHPDKALGQLATACWMILKTLTKENTK